MLISLKRLLGAADDAVADAMIPNAVAAVKAITAVRNIGELPIWRRI